MIPLADNVAITAGSGTTIAADELTDGTLGSVKVQFVKIMDGTLDGTSKAAVGANGMSVVANLPDVTATGTISANDAVVGAPSSTFVTGASTAGSLVAVLVANPGGDSVWNAQLTGSFGGGSIYFEISLDSTNGTDGNWISVTGRQMGITSTTISVAASAAGLYAGNVSGAKYFRVRIIGATAPSVPVILRVSSGSGIGFLNSSIPAGTNVIGHVVVDTGSTTALSSGGNTVGSIASVTTSIVPGTAATNLGKAENAAWTTADTGVGTLGVRRDTPTAAGTAGNYQTFQVSNLGQQWVVAARPKRNQITSGGLTTATTAYSVGDQVGTIFTMTNAAIATGGGGYLESVLLSDETSIIGTYTVWVFRSTVSAAADNAAFALSDADAQLLVGPPIILGPTFTATNNTSIGWYGSVPFDCSGTSLFALLQTNAGHTFFGATTSLKLTFTTSTLG